MSCLKVLVSVVIIKVENNEVMPNSDNIAKEV